MRIYNSLGIEVMSKILTQQTNTLETGNFLSGIYFYKVNSNDNVIQSGELISQ